MNSSIAQVLGLNADLFHWVVVPLLIFFARIADVSINTMRLIFMLGGRKNLAPVLGFFESLVWLLAISQILQNVGSPLSYIAYAAGFAAGIFVGMQIEERLALGTVIVQIITQQSAKELITDMKKEGFGLTVIDAEGSLGKVNVIFTVLQRQKLPDLVAVIQRFNPNTFFTVENVRYAKETVAYQRNFHSITDDTRR